MFNISWDIILIALGTSIIMGGISIFMGYLKYKIFHEKEFDE